MTWSCCSDDDFKEHASDIVGWYGQYCLLPFEDDTPTDPQDNWPEKKCKKQKKKCHKVKVRQNCLKTCGECQDLWSEKKCKKATAKKCKKAKFAKKCLESCGICEAAGL